MIIQEFKMKEDILEQLIEDYYVSKEGWFVKHNIKFRPDKNHKDYIVKKDDVYSDIDIMAINVLKNGIEKVHIISCKSWQGGFGVEYWTKRLELEATYNEKQIGKFQKRESWKYFRELVSEKWMDSFLDIIYKETGQKDFTYVIAVTKLKKKDNKKELLENSIKIIKRFNNKGSKINIVILTLETIVNNINERIKNKLTKTTPESTDIGRIMQLLYAANIIKE